MAGGYRSCDDIRPPRGDDAKTFMPAQLVHRDNVVNRPRRHWIDAGIAGGLDEPIGRLQVGEVIRPAQAEFNLLFRRQLLTAESFLAKHRETLRPTRRADRGPTLDRLAGWRLRHRVPLHHHAPVELATSHSMSLHSVPSHNSASLNWL